MAEPHVRFCLGKYVDKGEDAWLEKPASAVKPVTTDQGPRRVAALIASAISASANLLVSDPIVSCFKGGFSVDDAT